MTDTAGRHGNWGRWGAADERGAANLVTADGVLRALSLPARGEVINLGRPVVGSGMPMLTDRARPVHTFFVHGGDYGAGVEPDGGACVALDHLALAVHGNTSHVDALGHVWEQGCLYNGFDPATSTSQGMQRCGIDKLGGLVTRGVLVDVPPLLGRETLEGGERITPDLLEAGLERAGTSLAAGDVVLFRTGWFGWAHERPERYETYPGIDVDTAEVLATADVTGVGADTPAVECRPYSGTGRIPVHRLLLHRFGTYFFEMLDLDVLAGHEVGAFLFVAAPLRLQGGSGSPLNPLAIL